VSRGSKREELYQFVFKVRCIGPSPANLRDLDREVE